MQINKEAECEIVKKQMRKSQKDWAEYFNRKNLKMISAPDIYRTAKQGNKAILESLKKDFKENWEVTSTQIIYNKKNLNAKIIHDVDSTIVKPKAYNSVRVPVLNGGVGHDIDIEGYLQALFDTKDNINQILKILKRFDKDRKLWLWTPTQSSRASKQVRSVDLYFVGFDGFDVDGYNWFDDVIGLSRGVIVNSAKQSKKSRNKSK